MKKLQKHRQSGITLIALVVTILIIIILAGVTINLTVGENGIFSKAKYAKEKYTNEEYLEQEQLNELYAYLAKDNSLPENTKDTDAGTQVKLPSSWYTTTAAYVSTEDGKTVTKEVKTASVIAVATGSGETVPVPNGFYYVGGNKSTGVVISDNEADQNKYAGYEANGTTAKAVGVDLQGNQFVWIPCTIKEYKKCNTWNGINQTNGTLANANWETQTNSGEKVQIEKYEGFYIGRYEAGTSNIKGIDFANISTTGWTTDTAKYMNVTSGSITTKANEIPWYHANYKTAVEMSENMYTKDTKRNKYVRAGLVTGTMWDVMLNVMVAKTSCNVTSGQEWGNYYNNSWTISKGLYCEVDSNGGHNAWQTVSTSYSKAENSRVILSTAANSSFEKYNIYDISGNLWEWTQEAAYNTDTTERYMLRGCGFDSKYSVNPACYRGHRAMTHTGTNYGFRPALYIK